MKNRLSIIVAMSDRNVIGNDGKLPWNISEDLKLFKEKTIAKTVLMGRKTFESLHYRYRPLPDRHNIVLTSHDTDNYENAYPNVDFCNSVDNSLIVADSYDLEVFVIGGASIYKFLLPRTQRLYISHINGSYDGDTFFPKVDFKNDWKVVNSSERIFKNLTFRIYDCFN